MSLLDAIKRERADPRVRRKVLNRDVGCPHGTVYQDGCCAEPMVLCERPGQAQRCMTIEQCEACTDRPADCRR